MARRGISSLVGIGLASGLLTGCSLLTPLPAPSTLSERLDAFPTTGLPLEGDAVVHWSDRQVPFIEAETDGDAAFALGLVHAHLRLAQMALVRMIAQGRLSEIAGPVAVDIDRGLRILDFSRAVADIERGLSREARSWLERFVDGVNHYQARVEALPHEFAVLSLNREPWTVADVLTIGRLAGSDVNWLVWANVITLRAREDWPEIWARLIAAGSESTASFDAGDDLAALGSIIAGLSRSGSNSLAVAPERSTTGAAIMAGDPHLGVLVPNVWLIVGLKSPSYHAVGLMGPGLPIFALGRNQRIAWGGTNMRAASSELYDLAMMPGAAVTERRERIAVRWWFDDEVTIRDTPYGPVVSDAPMFGDLADTEFALKWTGHQASDEIDAMLAVSRAGDFVAFRAAFERFAVPGQNMLYADTDGNIGQVMAVRLPTRNEAPPDDMLLDPAAREPGWNAMQGAGDLPFSYNPERGFLVSANNRPAKTALRIGYFFSPDDRVERMAALLDGRKVGIAEIAELQRDVHVASSVRLRDRFLAALAEGGTAAGATAEEREVVERLAGWDGHYRPQSVGAAAFEQFRQGFTARFYELGLGTADGEAFAGFGRIKSLLIEDIDDAPGDRTAAALRAGLDAAVAGLGRFDDWGDMHRLALAHPLSAMPVIGSRYRFDDVAIGGSTDSLMKTAHDATAERHDVRYGSNARHISDMSDMDRNYFVLLGGQDGWLNSSTFLDQLPLWLAGDYVEVPLRIETVRETFPHRSALER